MKADKSKDQSPYVWQRDKIKDKLTIRELKWTEKQQQFINLVLDKKTRIVFVSGLAGTAKTFLAIYAGLRLLNEKRMSDIIYVRSAVESSPSKVGYLPGEVSDKMKFYGEPLMDKLEELLPTNQVKYLVCDKRVTVQPTNYSRGKSWNAKYIVMDEAQNSSIEEIVTILTRIGQFSKILILADPIQTDLKNGQRGGFENLYKLYDTDEAKAHGIFTFKFTKDDIVREEIIKFLMEQFEKIKGVLSHQ